jgi:hypothetical protein
LWVEKAKEIRLRLWKKKKEKLKIKTCLVEETKISRKILE